LAGPARLVEAAAERLADAVRTALDEPAAALGSWDATSVKGSSGALDAARSIYLIEGVARLGAIERPWSLILKVLTPVPGWEDPAGAAYWQREPLLCRSGLLDDLPGGLAAPRCLGVDHPTAGVAWLWQEHVREQGGRDWPLTRWALAARHFGQLNGAYLGRPLPEAPWLAGERLRAWLARHEPLVRRIAAAPDNPAVARWWPRPVVDAVLRLWAERDAFCDALARLPQTFGHGDAIRRNLFARGDAETVAIDWEHAGRHAPGEEVGQTLSVASAFYDVEPAALPALDDALFGGYLDGLRDAGFSGDPRPVRFAYAAHAALRNGFNAVGATVANEAGRLAAKETYGRSWEELAERRAELRPFLLGMADEARRLTA
jgi:hypothetical protein